MEQLCDKILGLYGSFPAPHKGRDRLVSFLEKRARCRWTGVRTIRRRGLQIETDFAVDDVGWTLYGYGCLDYWDERAIRKMLKPGSICLDIGAHIGYYSLLMSRWVGPNGHVFSYEPMPYTHSFLIRNLQRNGASNVSPQQAAVGAEAGLVRMSTAVPGRLGSSCIAEDGDLEVQCTTIDAEVRRLGIKRVDFIKMDVQAYEVEALRGGDQTLRRFRPALMLEVWPQGLRDHGESPARLADYFRSRNYDLFRASRGGFAPVLDLSDGSCSFFNVFARHRPDPARK